MALAASAHGATLYQSGATAPGAKPPTASGLKVRPAILVYRLPPGNGMIISIERIQTKNSQNGNLTFPNLCYIPSGGVHMVTNSSHLNATTLASDIPPLAVPSLRLPSRPSMVGAAVLTPALRPPSKSRSVPRRNVAGNQCVARFPFLQWGRGIRVLHINRATVLAPALHPHGHLARPTNQGKTSSNQGKNPCNRASSRLIKASAKKHLPPQIFSEAWRLEFGDSPPSPLCACVKNTRHQGSVKPPIKAKSPVIKAHQGLSSFIKANAKILKLIEPGAPGYWMLASQPCRFGLFSAAVPAE